MKSKEEIRTHVEDHWKYTEKIIMKMLDLVETAYIESGVHQHKHGQEDMFNKLKHLLTPEEILLWNQNHSLDET